MSLTLVASAPAFGQPKKAAPAKTAASRATVKSSTTKSAAHTTASKTASKGNAKGKKQAAPVKAWVQTQPSPSRYKEIQQALADKGYFGGTLDGNWGNDSTEALKRFQKDQNIEPDGKLGALSLIALGLGPKRGAQAAKVQPAVTPAPEQ